MKSYGILGRSSSGPKVEAPDKVCRWWRGLALRGFFGTPLEQAVFFWGGFCDKKGGDTGFFGWGET